MTTDNHSRTDRGSSARARRSGARSAIKAILAASLILSPAQETLHVLLAPHAHRHCPEHNRIEDVLASPDAIPHPAEGTGIGTHGANDGSHAPCRVLNATGAPATQLDPPESCAAVHNHQVSPARPRTASRQRTRVFLFAPKTSPPVAISTAI